MNLKKELKKKKMRAEILLLIKLLNKKLKKTRV